MHSEGVRIEQCAKRIRAYLAGEVVVDTTTALLVWENPSYPAYYLPIADVRATLIPSAEDDVFDIKAGDRVVRGAARQYAASPIEALRPTMRIDWHAMDEWLEEDEPVYTHPRSPYTRVDTLTSSRRVQVTVDGVTVADSQRPTILFETGLPPRFYLPLSDVRVDLLRPSEKQTSCPYKGTASYWSLDVNGTVYPDFVWMYRSPLAESQKIAGLVCFYNEKVDLTVDGKAFVRPRTVFS